MVLCAPLVVLALNVYHEARGEPLAGQLAVAQVTLRRAQYDERRVCKVVYARKQFSWTRHGRLPVRDRRAWVAAVRVAQRALLWAHGAPGHDFSAGATHYNTVASCPRWEASMVRVAVIGRHEFFVKRPTRRNSFRVESLPRGAVGAVFGRNKDK